MTTSTPDPSGRRPLPAVRRRTPLAALCRRPLTARTFARDLVATVASLGVVLGLASCSHDEPAPIDRTRLSLVTDARPISAEGTGTTSLAGELDQKLAAALPGATHTGATSSDQQTKALSSVPDGATAVLDPIDPAGIEQAVRAARDRGVRIVVVDTPLADPSLANAYIGWDAQTLGDRKIEAMATTLLGRNSDHLWNIELVSTPDVLGTAEHKGVDLSLRPYYNTRRITVKSGQMSINNTSTWQPDRLAKRLATTYTMTYPRAHLDAMVIPEDSLMATVDQVARRAGQQPPIFVTGQLTATGAAGLRQGTVMLGDHRDPAALTRLVTTSLDQLADDGRLDQPSDVRTARLPQQSALLVPQLVTADNAATVLAGRPDLVQALQG